MLESLKELGRLNDLVQADGEKFVHNGNKAAGTRMRLNMEAIKVLCHQMKKDVSASKREAEFAKS